MPAAVCSNGHVGYWRNTRGSRLASVRCWCGAAVKGTSGKPGRRMTKCVRCAARCEAGLRVAATEWFFAPRPSGLFSAPSGVIEIEGPFPVGSLCAKCDSGRWYHERLQKLGHE